MDNLLTQMFTELAASAAKAYEKEAEAFFNDYKNYMDASDMAYILSKAFHDMFWKLEENIERSKRGE